MHAYTIIRFENGKRIVTADSAMSDCGVTLPVESDCSVYVCHMGDGWEKYVIWNLDGCMGGGVIARATI